MGLEFRRKIDDVLLRWKKESKTALLLVGARQTGKTYAIRKLGKSFESFAEVNFADHPELIERFARAKTPEDLLVRISSIQDVGSKLKKGKTLIFLDEIQLVYKRREELKGTLANFISIDLLTAIKKLSEMGDYRFALSGSLLGATLEDIILYPAGYLEERRLFPMDFEEFLWARGIGEAAIDYLKTCFYEKREVDEDLHRQYLKLFREYVLVGGMPRPLNVFLESNNLHSLDVAQRDIVTAYRHDITRYVKDEGKKLRIQEIYAAMPSELNSKNKRFVFSHVLDMNYLKKSDPVDDYLWLKAAGIALPVYNVKEPKIPLGISMERKTMKLFLSDVGLLSYSLYNTGIRDKLLNEEEVVNYGAPYENAAAQELFAHGYEDHLYYWNSKKNGEVDFLVEDEDGILPIEIKSGKEKEDTYYNHSALNNLIKNHHPKKAYLFGQRNVKKESDIITEFPIYMIGFVKRRE